MFNIARKSKKGGFFLFISQTLKAGRQLQTDVRKSYMGVRSNCITCFPLELGNERISYKSRLFFIVIQLLHGKSNVQNLSIIITAKKEKFQGLPDKAYLIHKQFKIANCKILVTTI